MCTFSENHKRGQALCFKGRWINKINYVDLFVRKFSLTLCTCTRFTPCLPPPPSIRFRCFGKSEHYLYNPSSNEVCSFSMTYLLPAALPTKSKVFLSLMLRIYTRNLYFDVVWWDYYYFGEFIINFVGVDDSKISFFTWRSYRLELDNLPKFLQKNER